MARSKIYVGLEIGTSKISVVVGEVRPDGGIKILGVGLAPSRGVRKGEIVDFEAAQASLHEALIKAEERSDVDIKSVYLSITGAHIVSINNRGRIEVPGGPAPITEDDLEEVKEIARDVEIPQTNAFVHSIVRHYFVDGQEPVLNPVAMQGQVLEADYHIIHGIRTRIQNTIRCVREVPLEVEEIVFAPLASAQVVVNRAHKDQGTLLLDIGGGTTDYVLYHEGSVAASGCIGLGGDHVTNDIHVVLKLPLQTAERLKTKHGSVYFDSKARGETITIEPGRDFAGAQVDSNTLNHVIHARMKETLQLVHDNLEPTGYLDQINSGVFLTGGSSLLDGIGDLVQSIFKMPVHRAEPGSPSGIRTAFENPQYATPIGLIRYAQLLDQQTGNQETTGIGNKIGNWLKGR